MSIRPRFRVRADLGVWDAGAALITAYLMLLSGLGLAGLGRTILALGFVTFVPGWALLGRTRIAAPGTRAALAVALSFTVCSAGALAMVWLGQWHPQLLLDALGALSLAAVLLSRTREDQIT